MTLQTIKEGFAIMGATLAVHKGFVSIEFRGVRMDIRLNLSDSQIEGALFFLNLNITNWYKLVKEALAEEQEGGDS